MLHNVAGHASECCMLWQSYLFQCVHDSWLAQQLTNRCCCTKVWMMEAATAAAIASTVPQHTSTTLHVSCMLLLLQILQECPGGCIEDNLLHSGLPADQADVAHVHGGSAHTTACQHHDQLLGGWLIGHSGNTYAECSHPARSHMPCHLA